jgi:protein-arginine kinase activator protein McsA
MKKPCERCGVRDATVDITTVDSAAAVVGKHHYCEPCAAATKPSKSLTLRDLLFGKPSTKREDPDSV